MGYSHSGTPLSTHVALNTQVKMSSTDTPQCNEISSSADSGLTQFFLGGGDEITIFFCNNFPCGNRRAVSRSWWKGTAGRWHRQRDVNSATDQFPIRRISYFTWTPV